MQYKIYKKMNNLQRLEWHYRFNRKFEPMKVLILVLAWRGITVFTAMYSWFFASMDMTARAVEFWDLSYALTRVEGWLILVVAVMHLGRWIYCIDQEQKWLIKEGLK